MTTSLADRLWHACHPLVTQCLEHRFVRGLADGTLPQVYYTQYVTQDSLFLKEYVRVLRGMSKRHVSGEVGAALANALGPAIAVQEQYEEESRSRGVDPARVQACHVVVAFSEFLDDSGAEGIGAFLAATTPCLRLYAELGRHLMPFSSREAHPYRKWITQYGSSEVMNATREWEKLLNVHATDERAASRVYTTGMEHEIRFFDAVCR